nr:hypothetical protein [Tanacetum cinerariifolium]
MGWSGEGVGTVQVVASVREYRMREMEFRRENGLGSLSTLVPSTTLTLGALSHVRADLLLPRKRIRASSVASSPEDNIKGIIEIGSKEEDIHSNVMADIEGDDEAKKEAESSARGTVEIRIDKVVELVVSDDVADIKRDQRAQRRRELIASGTMPTIRFGMKPEAIEEMIARRVAKAIEAYDTNRNQGPMMESGDEHEDNQGDGGNNGNGNGNGMRGGNEGGNPSIKTGDSVPIARESQELVLLCTNMVPEDEDQGEKFIGGIPINIQGNVIAAEPAILKDAIRIAKNLMDRKLKGYATRKAENKRRVLNLSDGLFQSHMVAAFDASSK